MPRRALRAFTHDEKTMTLSSGAREPTGEASSVFFFPLGLLKSTTLYGALAALICVFVFGLEASSLVRGEPPVDPEWFIAFMRISFVAYPILVLVHVVYGRAWSRKRASSRRGVYPGVFVYDITNPFRGLLAPMGSTKGMDPKGFYRYLSMFTACLHFVWAVALLVTLVIGLVSIATR